MGKGSVAGTHDPPFGENVHEVRHDVVEQPLVVSDEEDAVIGCAEPIDAVGDDLQRIGIAGLLAKPWDDAELKEVLRKSLAQVVRD